MVAWLPDQETLGRLLPRVCFITCNPEAGRGDPPLSVLHSRWHLLSIVSRTWGHTVPAEGLVSKLLCYSVPSLKQLQSADMKRQKCLFVISVCTPDSALLPLALRPSNLLCFHHRCWKESCFSLLSADSWNKKDTFPIPGSLKVKVAQWCLTLCDPTDSYSSWSSPGQNIGVGSLCLLQGIFPTQGSNLGLPHCSQILYQLSHKASCPQGNSPVTVIIAHCIHSFIPELIHTLIQQIFSECPLSKLWGHNNEWNKNTHPHRAYILKVSTVIEGFQGTL